MSVGDFPGYNSVLFSYRLLCTIVCENLPSWKTALSNVSGVYIITDNNNGKHYIGSSYGEGWIWKRWVRYTKDGHGGNKELKGYVYNFQFSLLETCDLNVNEEYVISRESHWKDVLQSRKFGLNNN